MMSGQQIRWVNIILFAVSRAHGADLAKGFTLFAWSDELRVDVDRGNAETFGSDEPCEVGFQPIIEAVFDSFMKKDEVLPIEHNSSRIAVPTPHELVATKLPACRHGTHLRGGAMIVGSANVEHVFGWSS
jgi:hypothetical protein